MGLVLELVGVILILLVVICVWGWFTFDPSSEELVSKKKKYHYTLKRFFLTKAEHEFYDVLDAAVGSTFVIVPQAHLASFLEYKTERQDWRAARAHIDRKSVDFLLCDKKYLNPKLGIELDDRSHEREDRLERDGEVERILKEAKLPLLRVPVNGSYNSQELQTKIQNSCNPLS